MNQQDINALTSAIQNLDRTLKGSSSLVGSGATRGRGRGESPATYARSVTQSKRVEELNKKAVSGVRGLNEITKQLKKSSTRYSDSVKLADMQLQSMISGLETDKLDVAAKRISKKLNESGNAWTRHLGSQIKSGKDLITMRERIATGEYQATVKRIKADEKLSRQVANKLGVSINELNDSTVDFKNNMQDFADTTIEVHQEFSNLQQRSERTADGLIGLKTAALAAANALADSAISAARTGTQMEYFDAMIRGMTPEELNELQAEYRQTIASSNISFEEFNARIARSQWGLSQYTGSLRDAARMNAQAAHQAALLGASQEEYTNRQQEQFKRLNKGLSVTVEEFMSLNETLMNSESVQSQLYRVNNRQRQAYIQDLQMTYERLRVNGLMAEQAERMLETFEAIGAKSPKERLKEAAKLQAVMGAMGMGAQGAEARQLMMGGLRGEGEKARFGEIMRDANIRIGERMSQGFASELLSAQMIQTAGLEQYLGPNSEFAVFNKQQNMTIDESYIQLQRQTGLLGGANTWLERIAGHLIGVKNILGQFFTSELAIAIGGIAAMFGGGRLATLFKDLASTITSGLASAVNKLSTAASSLFSKAGLARLGAVGAAGAATWQAFKAVQTGESDIHNWMTSFDFGQQLSDKLGEGLHWVESLWSEEAQKRIDMMDKAERVLENGRDEDNKAAQRTEKLTNEQLKLQRQQIFYLEQMMNAENKMAQQMEEERRERERDRLREEARRDEEQQERRKQTRKARVAFGAQTGFVP